MGIVLGIGAGLLLDSILFVMVDVFAVLASFTSGLLLTVPVVIGIMVGRRVALNRWLPEVPWAVIAVVAVVGWPLCIYAPVRIRTSNLQWIASKEAPIYPNADKVETYVGGYGGTKEGSYARIVLRTSAAREDIEQFYDGEMIRRGWKRGRSFWGRDWFRKRGRSMSIYIWEPHQTKAPPSWWSEAWKGFTRVEITFSCFCVLPN